MFTGTTAFLQVRHTETSPLPATEPGAGRPPTAIGTETAIGITGIGTETVIGTVIEIATGTAITTEITMIVDYIADGTNTIAITTMTGMGIMTGIATAIAIATTTMTMTMTKIMIMIANWRP
jgi:hypothetical protein